MAIFLNFQKQHILSAIGLSITERDQADALLRYFVIYMDFVTYVVFVSFLKYVIRLFLFINKYPLSYPILYSFS